MKTDVVVRLLVASGLPADTVNPAPTATQAVADELSQSLPTISCASTVCAPRLAAASLLSARPASTLVGQAQRATLK